MNRRIFLLCVISLLANPLFAADQEAREIVRSAIDYFRDSTSYAEARMRVHRADWDREMALKSWTRGTKDALVRFTAPARDAGNASLTLDQEMWSFSPKVNRVIKIPPSMKNQSWMGSDFSYDDLSKGDEIVDRYTHTLLRTETSDGKKVSVVESVPLEDAAVVWGKEILFIREDRIIIRHEFYDQDGKLAKVMLAKEISTLGGKLYPTTMRMENLQEPGEWTEVIHDKAEFGKSLPATLFTLSSLQNPRS